MAINVPTGPAQDPSTVTLTNPGQVAAPTPYYQTGGPNGNVAATFSTTAPAAATTTNAGSNTATDANASKIADLISSGTNAAIAGGQAGVSQAAGNIQGLGDSLATTIGTGQNTIDEARKNIGVGQINSIKQLMNTIRQGLQGTGVSLGNSNALDSSAAGAAARAFSNYGNVQTNSINNSAATGNADQDVAQKNLDLTSTNGMAAIKAARDSAVGSIQAQAAQALQGLATTIAYMGGDTSKIPIQDIQAQIVQNAQDQLSTVDQNISSLIGGYTPATADQTATAAESASNAGVVPSSQTNFNTVSPFGTAPPSANGTNLGGAQTSLIPLVVGKPQNQTTGV